MTSGKIIAIDTSIWLHQILKAPNAQSSSHLLGIFNRSIRLLENGIKPVYVFDGKPPNIKSDELKKRREKREEAQKQLEKASEAGNANDIEKYKRRSLFVTREHNAEVKELLRLMGIPCIDAPSEAEAQCAAMTKAGKVYATATEDMDALAFGSRILLTGFKANHNDAIHEYHYDEILAEMEFTREEVCSLSDFGLTNWNKRINISFSVH